MKNRVSSFLELEEEISKIKQKKRIQKPKDEEAFLYLIEQLRSQGYAYNEIASKIGFSRMSVYRILKKLKSYKSV